MQSSYFGNRNNRNYKPNIVTKEPVYPDHFPGKKHTTVAHFAAHNVIETKEIVHLRLAEDHKLGPPAGWEVYADPSSRDNSPFGPFGPETAQPGVFPPKFQPHPVYAKTKDPARFKFQTKKSPNHCYDPGRDYGKHSDDDDNYEDEDHDVYDYDNHDTPYKGIGQIKPGDIYNKDKNKKHAYNIPSRDEKQYNDSDDRPNRNYGYAPPIPKILIPQIKTRVGDREFAKESTKNQRKGHREVIDGRPSTLGGPYMETKYDRTIDCKKAAEMYDGVFITD